MGGLHGYGRGRRVGATRRWRDRLHVRRTRSSRACGDTGKGLLVKAVDVGPRRPTISGALALIGETLVDPAVVEVGYRDGLRYTVNLTEEPACDGRPALALGPDSVVVVTGAAGGITSAIVGDLAMAGAGIFYLLDLAHCPNVTTRTSACSAKAGTCSSRG